MTAQAVYAHTSSTPEDSWEPLYDPNGHAGKVMREIESMYPAHRADTLREVGQRLQAGLPAILVATRVVEAGVDISFPLVYRDRCGPDSPAQSAGRCNLPAGVVPAARRCRKSLRPTKR